MTSRKLRANTGFTLLELLVIILFISVLALLSYPILFNQINKARHIEAKNYLGTSARAQQAYHFELGTFSGSMDVLGVSLNSKYYTFPDPDTFSNTMVEMKAIPIDPGLALKRYAYGVYFDSNSYATLICESDEPNGDAEVGNTITDGCVNGVEVPN